MTCRYLSDDVTKLPLSVMGRLVSSNDVPMALVALLDSPPWKRRRGGKQEVWQDNSWVVVPPADRLKLTQADAQVGLVMMVMWPTATRYVLQPTPLQRSCGLLLISCVVYILMGILYLKHPVFRSRFSIRD